MYTSTFILSYQGSLLALQGKLLAFQGSLIGIARKKIGIARKFCWHSKEGKFPITMKHMDFSFAIIDKENNSDSVGITEIGDLDVL